MFLNLKRKSLPKVELLNEGAFPQRYAKFRRLTVTSLARDLQLWHTWKQEFHDTHSPEDDDLGTGVDGSGFD